MNKVEDLVYEFQEILTKYAISGHRCYFGSWHQNFINSVYNYLMKGDKVLSTGQATTILKMANNHRKELIADGINEQKLDAIIRSPSYYNQPYQSVDVPKEVRYLGDDRLGFRFKKDDTIKLDIKALGGVPELGENARMAFWSPKNRIWIVSVTRTNHQAILTLIKTHRFSYDMALLEFMTLAANSQGAISTFEYDPDSNQFIVNVCDNEFLYSWVRFILGGQQL